jgi:hypothetical protein
MTQATSALIERGKAMESLVSDQTACAYTSAAEIETFIRAFEECTLPRKDWSHPAHLIVALWYLLRRSEPEATSCIRKGILSYNAANGIKTTSNSGYHETITLFWTKLVAGYLSRVTEASIVQLANGVVHAFGNKNSRSSITAATCCYRSRLE